MQVAMKTPNLNEFNTMEAPQKKIDLKLVSPIIKSHSRGARFLDLVKNNKLNVSPQLSKRLSMTKNVMERNEKKSENNDYLKFSNGTPNLNSSPSSSILSKRKSVAVETPDSPGQNHSAKRKRVSFNDPVSTTKEYLITEEEERLKSNSLIRCLTYENDENNLQEDEECENKENIIAVAEEKMDTTFEKEDIVIKVKTEEIEIETNSVVLDHDYDESPQNTDITTSSIEDVPEQQAIQQFNDEKKLVFKDNDELMDYVSKNFTFNDIIEKFLQTDEEQSLKRKEIFECVFEKVDPDDLLNELLPIQDPKHAKMTKEQVEQTSNVINHLSRMMKVNDRIKHKVLDTLSEKHSKDFLSHALQENSVTTVCQKITIPSIINYLIHKVNVCDDDEIDLEINRMNRHILHHLIKKTSKSREIIIDQKELQELLKLMFQNTPKIEVLDTVHEFLRSNIIQGPF